MSSPGGGIAKRQHRYSQCPRRNFVDHEIGSNDQNIARVQNWDSTGIHNVWGEKLLLSLNWIILFAIWLYNCQKSCKSKSIFIVKVWQNCADVNILPKSISWNNFSWRNTKYVIELKSLYKRLGFCLVLMINHLYPRSRVSDTQWPSNRKLPLFRKKTVEREHPPNLKEDFHL